MAAPGDFAPGERAHGAHAAAARRAARTRTGPRAAIRLSGQPYPVGDRDPAVLPPGGMVGVAAGARRARALLRRSRRRRVRGPTLLREGAARYGAAPRHAAGLRSGGGGARWLAHGPHPAARGAGADGDLSPLDGWRARRGPRTRRRRPRGAGTAARVPSDGGGMRTATLDSLIHRVEALRSPDARHEAVKTLGRRRDPRMVPPLLAIAQQDPNEEVQDEAVEALGKVRGSAGVGALIDIARTHPNPGVRRKAVKTVGDVATPEMALDVLERLAYRDPDARVQQKAVEALGHLGSAQAIAPLARQADPQPTAAPREEAVEQYARTAAPDSALDLLVDRLANDSSSDVQVEAVERLADLPDGLGIPALRAAARPHPRRHLRPG